MLKRIAVRKERRLIATQDAGLTMRNQSQVIVVNFWYGRAIQDTGAHCPKAGDLLYGVDYR